MERKFFKLANGLQFDTPGELKAYIRGLELMRTNLTLSAADAAKVATWLDDAHSAKAGGAKTAAQHEAAKPKPAKKDKKA